jgi:hypothetical protein
MSIITTAILAQMVGDGGNITVTFLCGSALVVGSSMLYGIDFFQLCQRHTPEEVPAEVVPEV